VEDEPGRLQVAGGEHLHEAREGIEIMRLRSILYAVIIVGASVMILSTAIGIQP